MKLVNLQVKADVAQGLGPLVDSYDLRVMLRYTGVSYAEMRELQACIEPGGWAPTPWFWELLARPASPDSSPAPGDDPMLRELKRRVVEAQQAVDEWVAAERFRRGCHGC